MEVKNDEEVLVEVDNKLIKHTSVVNDGDEDNENDDSVIDDDEVRDEKGIGYIGSRNASVDEWMDDEKVNSLENGSMDRMGYIGGCMNEAQDRDDMEVDVSKNAASLDEADSENDCGQSNNDEHEDSGILHVLHDSEMLSNVHDKYNDRTAKQVDKSGS